MRLNKKNLARKRVTEINKNNENKSKRGNIHYIISIALLPISTKKERPCSAAEKQRL